MPILVKCSSCGREGGYAEKESDKICKRCKTKMLRGREAREEKQSAQQNKNN